jgi:integrase
LLYGCGLRVSEAVRLQCRDVDLKNGILTVREAKNGRDRLIPVAQSLLMVFREYRNDVIPWATDDDYFFMAPSRTILSPVTVYGRFRRILWDGGIPYGGKGNGPRLHDLRHTFAVHTLQKWVETGEDLTAMLPVLSVFMGHKSLKATSRYLRLTAEVYPNVIRQVEDSCAYVIPNGEGQ